jgi:hypothetical protein
VDFISVVPIGMLMSTKGRLAGSVPKRLEAELSCGETSYSAEKHRTAYFDSPQKIEKLA